MRISRLVSPRRPLGRMRSAAAVLSLALTCLTLPHAGATSTHICFGLAATIVGTPGHDSLVGTARADVIVGLGGNDFIRGLAGNDRICGGGGNDSADFDGGVDAPGLEGSAGNDRIAGGPGFDDLNGGPVPSGRSAGADVLLGGKNHDHLCDNWCFRFLAEGETGTGPDDRLYGGLGADLLITTAGNDLSDGGAGGDTLGGGFGDTNPSELVPRGRDTYHGRGGDDTIEAADGVSGNDSVNGGPHTTGDDCAADRGDDVVNCNP